MIKKIFFELRKNTNYAVNAFGIDLVKSSEDFLDKKWNSPIELIYKTHNRYILLKAPIKKIRFLGLHGYKAGYKSRAPFISTLKEYKEKEVTNYKASALQRFYSDFQPNSISEYLYLKSSSSSLLASLPASGAFLPWEDIDPREQVKQRALQIDRDNKEHKSSIDFNEGDPFYGPVSIHKANLEYNRLTKIFESIKKDGFKIDTKGKSNIIAIMLEHDCDYRFFIISGQHRVAALSALDYDNIALQVYKGLIVRRSEVEFWPGVTSQYFTELEALSVFDRIFSGLD